MIKFIQYTHSLSVSLTIIATIVTIVSLINHGDACLQSKIEYMISAAIKIPQNQTEANRLAYRVPLYIKNVTRKTTPSINIFRIM